MNEETKSQSTPPSEGEPGASTSSSGPTSTKASGQELLDELNRLGQNLAEVVEAAWKSDERRRVQEDLRTGLVTLTTTLEESITRITQSKQGREILDKAEDVAETLGQKVRSSQVTNDLATVLAKGLRSLSEQVEKLSEELQKKPAGQSPTSDQSKASDGPQDIPISRDS